ncbi:MAG: hypothetical protein JW883_02080 [Deltaproteobacteria bacterium]|jgi:hypothetical protein|nr:hypothetical protein [Deltaproteobacteria bacterium]
MDIFRIFGIMIVFGAPAIIGGGLTYHLFENWFVVAVFEALLIFGGITTAVKVAGKSAPSHH